jgi:hypothetical protein
MRHLNTGRGHHHKCTANTFRMFMIAEATATAALLDMIGGTSLTITGTPTLGTDGWLGPNYRSFDGSTNGASGGGAGSDAVKLTANTWTIGLVWRRRASAAGTIFCFGGNSGTVANNVLARLKMASDGGLTFEWEDATPTLRSVAIPTYKLPLGKWTYLHIVRTAATTVAVYVNGRLIATLAMTSANSGGTTSIWNVAMDEGAANKISGDLGSLYCESGALAATTLYADVRRATLQAFPTSVRARVKIKNGLGTYVDLTSLEGQDFVDSFTLKEDADTPCESATVNLTREIELLSLANLMTSSKLNLTNVANLSSYSPLIDPARELLIEMARVPLGFTTPASTDWVQRFHGYTDEVDWGGDGSVTVTARDDGGFLIDDFLSTTFTMPITTGVACAADSTYNPSMPRGSMEEALQDLLNQVSDGVGRTLYAPSAANLCLIQWQQKQDSVMAAARSIAGVKAWDFGYMFDESPGQNTTRPTLIDPGRARVDADGVIDRTDYAQINKASLDVFQVRNRVFVTCADKNNVTDSEGGGDPVRAPLNPPASSTDSTSKTRYGGIWRTIFITEGETSPIDELSEAQAMSDAILADLKDPLVLVDVDDVSCFFEAELYDIYTMVGDNVHWSGDQVVATAAVKLEYKSGAGSCSLGMRGKPSAGARRWLSLDARPGMAPASWNDPARPTRGINQAQIAAINELVYRRSGAGRGLRVDLIRNGEFQQRARGTGYMPDGWWRANASGVPASPFANGQDTTNTTMLFEQVGSKSGAGMMHIIGNPQFHMACDFFPVRGNKRISREVVSMYAGTPIAANGYIEWYDEKKAYLSSSTAVLPLPIRLNAPTVDDSGAANAIQVTTTLVHGLAVGDYFVIDGTTNYQTLGINGRALYKVATVNSTTQVTATSVSGGGLAAEAGNISKWTRSASVSVLAPIGARFARYVFAGGNGLVGDYYIDKVGFFELSPELRVNLSANQTPIADATWTVVHFNTVTIDSEGAYDNVTNFIWTCPEDGNYRIFAHLAAQVTGTTCTFAALSARLNKNSGTIIAQSPTSSYLEAAAAATVTGRAAISTHYQFTKGDTLVVEGWISQVTGTVPVRAWVGGADASYLHIKQVGNE